MAVWSDIALAQVLRQRRKQMAVAANSRVNGGSKSQLEAVRGVNICEKPLVSVVVPNWNGKYLLRPCLESLENLTYPSLEVIVVDNGSTDGSEEMVRKEFPRVKVIISLRNLGFAGACNLGMKSAKGEIIALFNNDATAEPSWLTELVNTIGREADVGIASGPIFHEIPRGILCSAGARIDAVTGIDWRVGYGKRLDQIGFVSDVDYLPGCALIFPKKLIDKIGFLDENYFLYCEEMDWALCAKRLGYTCKLNFSAVVWHKGSTTRRRIPLQGYYHQVRGLFRVYFKHFPLKYLITSLFFQLAVFPTFEIFFFRTSPLFVLQRMKAFLWNLTRLKDLILQRNRVKLMGSLTLKNRFKEFLEISRGRIVSKEYDF